MSQQLRNEQIDLIPLLDNDARAIGSPTKRFSDGYFVKITTSGDISDTIKTVFSSSNLLAIGTPFTIDGYNTINIGNVSATGINIGKIGNFTTVKEKQTVTDNLALPPNMLLFSGALGPFVSGVSHTTNVTLNPGDVDTTLRLDLSLTGGGLWDNGGGANTASVAHQVNFQGGVKGTKCIFSTYLQGLGVGDSLTASSGIDTWGGITPQFGGTSVATPAAEAVGEFDMASAGGARWSAYTPVPVQTANTAIFHATVTGSPAPHATTIAYAAGTNPDKIGCRFILNKSHAKNDGYVTAVSLDFSNLQTTVTFTGTTFATSDVGRYIKIGANDDLYPIVTAADFKGDDISLDGFGVGHWYRIKSRPSPTQLIIEGIWDTLGFPKSYALIQGAGAPYLVLDGVEISSYTTTTFNTPANTNTWSNGDILYSPPHHYQGFLGLNLILQKNFRNTFQSVSSNDAIRVRSIGLSPLDVGLLLSGTTIDGYGGYTKGIEMIGCNPDIGIDVSNIHSNTAAIRLAQNEKLLLDGNSSVAPYIAGLSISGVKIAGQVGQTSLFATDDFNSDFIVRHPVVGRVDFADATNDVWLTQRQTADVSIGPGGFGSQAITITPSKLFTNKGRNVKVTTAAISYSILPTDHCIMVEGTAAPITITLPSSPSNGDTYIIKDAQGRAGLFNITVSGTSNIDGYSSLVMEHNYQCVTVIFDSFSNTWETITSTGGNSIGNFGYKTTSTITSLYTASIGDLVKADPSGGSFTVNLPTAIGNKDNSIIVKNNTSSTNTITVDAFGSETIDGSLTRTISIAYQSITLVSDGSNWMVV